MSAHVMSIYKVYGKEGRRVNCIKPRRLMYNRSRLILVYAKSCEVEIM